MSAPVTPAPEAVSGQPPLSEVQRLINVFFAPSKTFADLRRSAAWWGPILVLIISSSAYVYTIQTKVGWNQVVQNMLANMGEKEKTQFENAPPERQQQQVQGMRIGVKYMSWIFWVVILVINVICAALLMATFNFGLGTSIPYSRAFAITMYAGVPGILRSVLAIITMFAGADPEAFNLQNPVGTNLAFYVSRDSVGALYPLLETLDVFMIWFCILLGMGFAVVGGKKKSTGIAVVFGWLAAITLLRVGWAAIMG